MPSRPGRDAGAAHNDAGKRIGYALPGDPAADTSPAFPTFVHLPADQAAHPSSAFEWWYVVGHLTGGGHRFGYEITLTFSRGVPETHIAITDQTTGRYYQHVAAFPPSQATASRTGLDVRMPTGSLSGRMDDMALAGSLPAGGRRGRPTGRPLRS